MDTATAWFAKHLSIAGFSESFAAFTTFKELVDNGVDASRCSPLKRIIVRIDSSLADGITNSTKTCPFFTISVSDYGKGFTPDCVEALTGLFGTTKHDSEAIGKFGVGLKLITLSSHKQTGKPVVIETPSFRLSLRVVKDGIDIDGLVAKGLARSANEEDPAGSLERVSTTITAAVKCPDYSVLVRHAKRYISELSFNLVGWDLKLFVDGSEVPLDVLEPTMMMGVTDANRLVHANLEIFPRREDPLDQSNEPSESSDDSDEPRRSPTKTTTVRILIIRSVNSVPLIYNGAECSIQSASIAALTQAIASLGIQSISPAHPTDGDRLVATAKAEAIQDCKWSKIVIRSNVNLPADACEYSSLIKSGLTSKDGKLYTAVLQNVMKLFRLSKKKFPGFFRSADDVGREMAEKLYIPCIAESVTNIIKRDRNPRLREGCEKIIGRSDLPLDEFCEEVRRFLVEKYRKVLYEGATKKDGKRKAKPRADQEE